MQYHHILSFKAAKVHILRDIEFAIGVIPSTLGDCSELIELDLSSNVLSGNPSTTKLYFVMMFVTCWFQINASDIECLKGAKYYF